MKTRIGPLVIALSLLLGTVQMTRYLYSQLAVVQAEKDPAQVTALPWGMPWDRSLEIMMNTQETIMPVIVTIMVVMIGLFLVTAPFNLSWSSAPPQTTKVQPSTTVTPPAPPITLIEVAVAPREQEPEGREIILRGKRRGNT